MASESPIFLKQVSPSEYLELARELASRSDGASQRTAGDRAYYAAFLFTRDTLFGKGYAPDLTLLASHRNVARALARFVGQTLEERSAMRQMGDQLREAREALTYETNEADTRRRIAELGIMPEEALSWMLTTASQIIAAVAALPAVR